MERAKDWISYDDLHCPGPPAVGVTLASVDWTPRVIIDGSLLTNWMESNASPSRLGVELSEALEVVDSTWEPRAARNYLTSVLSTSMEKGIHRFLELHPSTPLVLADPPVMVEAQCDALVAYSELIDFQSFVVQASLGAPAPGYVCDSEPLYNNPSMVVSEIETATSSFFRVAQIFGVRSFDEARSVAEATLKAVAVELLRGRVQRCPTKKERQQAGMAALSERRQANDTGRTGPRGRCTRYGGGASSNTSEEDETTLQFAA